MPRSGGLRSPALEAYVYVVTVEGAQLVVAGARQQPRYPRVSERLDGLAQ